jgi:hypothetical protein
MAIDLEAMISGAMEEGQPPAEEAAPGPVAEPDSGMKGFDLPVPGQSLTAEPGSVPYEQPPQFTKLDKAVDYLFESMTKQNNVDNILRIIDTGMPLSDLAQPIVMNGTSEGLWNVDMAMNLIEPTIAIMAGLAAMAGVTPVMNPEPKEHRIDTSAFKKAVKGADVGAKQSEKSVDASDLLARKDDLLKSAKKSGGLLSKEGMV